EAIFPETLPKWAAKAALISNHLRRLNNSQRGSSPRLTWQAVKACVITTALYWAEPASHDIHLYTDGSCYPGDKAGRGYNIYQAQEKIAAEGFPIDRRVEQTDAEIIAIHTGLMRCISKAMTKFTTNIIIYCDNKTVIDILGGKIPETSRKDVYKISQIQAEWTQRVRLAHVATGDVFGQFIPGHRGKNGNDYADSLAKAGA
ncbi:hypothetical protein EPUL_006055, partial [Erysiphe pulchra]